MTNRAPVLITSGLLDTDFSGDGKTVDVLAPGPDHAYAAAAQSDGKLVVAGQDWNGSQYEIGVMRYNADGTLDATFDGDGQLTTSIGTLGAIAQATAVQADGKILIAGASTSIVNQSQFVVVRYNTDGSLDSSFDGDGKLVTSFGTTVESAGAIALQADGKILVAGHEGNATDLAIARYAANGSLDTTFSDDGKLILSVGGVEDCQGLLVQADGKILVASSSGVARLNADGSLDTTFSGDGKLEASLEGMALQDDGKIVVSIATTTDFTLQRYNSDGTLDLTFGGGDGTAELSSPGTTWDYTYNISLQEDGRIVAGGFVYYAGDGNEDFALARFNSDGSADLTFGGNGVVLTDMGSTDRGFQLVVQPDGEIVLAGDSGGRFGVLRLGVAVAQTATEDQAFSYNLPAGSFYDPDGDTLTITATLADGSALPSWLAFNAGSLTFSGTPVNSDVGMVSVKVTATDPSLASVSDTFRLTVVNVNDAPVVQTPIANQSVDEDESFFLNVSTAFHDDDLIYGDSLVYSATRADNSALPDWLIFDPMSGAFAGTPRLESDLGSFGIKVTATDESLVSVTDTFNMTVHGINDAPVVLPLAVLDTGFSGDGRAMIPFSGTENTGSGIAVQANGKLVVAGTSLESGTGNDFAVARINANGGLDTTFSDDGKITTPIGTGSDQAYAVTLQADGKILVVGATQGADWNFALARYNVNGTLDTSFSGDGRQTTNVSGDDVAYGVAVQQDGRIIVAGTSGQDFALARYDAIGSLDVSFSGDGKQTTSFGASSDVARGIAIQGDGKILAAGWTLNGDSNDIAIARYNADGSLDNTFSGDGLFTVGGAEDQEGYALAIQGNGKILIAGKTSTGSDTDFMLIRLNANGTLDTSFGGGDGIVTTDIGSTEDGAYGVAVQADGKILVSGYTYSFSNYDFAITRYNANGTLDTSFDGDGIYTADFGGGTDRAYGVTLDRNGDIVVAGEAWNGSNADFGVLRLHGLQDLTATEDILFSFTVASNRFFDTEGDALTYSASLTSGAALPGWLSFDAGTRTFTGTPSSPDLGAIHVKVTATDGGGASASDSFAITIAADNNNLIVGTSGPDTLSGTALADTIDGREDVDSLLGIGGNDVLQGGAGNDNLNGGAGNDTMIGGTGADTYIVGQAGDVVMELPGQGIDLVKASISYTLGANVENLTLTGSGDLNGAGNGGGNVITGNNGKNVLDGDTGADTLKGMGGNDTLIWGASDKSVDGGAGTDVLKVMSGSLNLLNVLNTLIVDVETIDLRGGGNNKLTLNQSDVLDMSSTDSLKVLGDLGDTIHISGAHTNPSDNLEGFNRISLGGVIIQVDTDIQLV